MSLIEEAEKSAEAVAAELLAELDAEGDGGGGGSKDSELELSAGKGKKSKKKAKAKAKVSSWENTSTAFNAPPKTNKIQLLQPFSEFLTCDSQRLPAASNASN